MKEIILVSVYDLVLNLWYILLFTANTSEHTLPKMQYVSTKLHI